MLLPAAGVDLFAIAAVMASYGHRLAVINVTLTIIDTQLNKSDELVIHPGTYIFVFST